MSWPLQMGIPVEELSQKISSMHEFNPMLGFRGCRLSIIYPEILRMQVGRSSRPRST